jgi:hypothetical protein
VGNADQAEERDAVTASFRLAYVEGCPFSEDRALAGELSLEAVPAIDALAFALDQNAEGDLSRIEHHEGLAMVTLLGRRAGALGATPTAAIHLVPALVNALSESGRKVPEELVRPLTAMCFEGYVAAREEGLREAQAAASIDNAAIVRLVPRGLGLILAGEHEEEVLAEIVERLGRKMLKHDAAAAVVDISRLEGATKERAAEVFGAHGAARMLGATCVFAGASQPWLDAAREARVDLDVLTLEPTFNDALRRALPLCGYELKTTSWLPGPLKKVLRRG